MQPAAVAAIVPTSCREAKRNSCAVLKRSTMWMLDWTETVPIKPMLVYWKASRGWQGIERLAYSSPSMAPHGNGAMATGLGWWRRKTSVSKSWGQPRPSPATTNYMSPKTSISQSSNPACRCISTSSTPSSWAPGAGASMDRTLSPPQLSFNPLSGMYITDTHQILIKYRSHSSL